MKETAAALAVDGGDLPLGAGLLALIRPALGLLEAEGVLAVLSSSAAVREDLPSWCRVERCAYLGHEKMPDGRDRHRNQNWLQEADNIRTNPDHCPCNHYQKNDKERRERGPHRFLLPRCRVFAHVMA